MWHNVWDELHDAFTRGTSFTYNLLYVVLIYFFCYFWTAITFNPEGHGRQLERSRHVHSRLPAGQRTADHLESVMVRITYVGAGFLAVVAIMPTIVSNMMRYQPSRWPAFSAAPAC